MISPGVYNERVLDGLDYFLMEIGEHDMRAVMVLNNYWQWSGGMAQYVSYGMKAALFHIQHQKIGLLSWITQQNFTSVWIVKFGIVSMSLLSSIIIIPILA